LSTASLFVCGVPCVRAVLHIPPTHPNLRVPALVLSSGVLSLTLRTMYITNELPATVLRTWYGRRLTERPVLTQTRDTCA
jgi:hypothetical protein